MFEKVKAKMDAFAERMAAVQTKIFLNLFYVLMAPFAYVYLHMTGNKFHDVTGHFQDAKHKHNELDRHKKQY